MLKSINIKNYKSCENVSTNHIGQLVVLVGRNGAGKSNILKAVDWMARSSTSSTPLNLSAHLSANAPARASVTLDFKIDQSDYSYTFEVGLDRNRNKAKDNQRTRAPAAIINEDILENLNGKEQDFVRRKGSVVEMPGREPISISPNLPCLPALISLLPQDDAVVPRIRSLVTFLHGIRYYHFDEPNDLPVYNSLISEDEYKEWASQYTADWGDPGDSVQCRILNMYLESIDKLEELRSLLGPDGLNLIESVEIVPFDLPMKKPGDNNEGKRRYYFLQFNPTQNHGGTKNDFEYGELSLGTRRVIRILVSLLFDDSSIILGEHPEDAIHSGLTKKLIAFLRRYVKPGQLILSSHSLVVFNTLSPGDVRLVAMLGGKTTVRPLSQREIDAASKFISEEGAFSDVIEAIQDE